MYLFSRDIKSYLLDFCQSFGFKSHKDWWGMNSLHLMSPSNTSTMVYLEPLILITCFNNYKVYSFFKFDTNFKDYTYYTLYNITLCESYNETIQVSIFILGSFCSWSSRCQCGLRWHSLGWHSHEWQCPLARAVREGSPLHANAYQGYYLMWWHCHGLHYVYKLVLLHDLS